MRVLLAFTVLVCCACGAPAAIDDAALGDTEAAGTDAGSAPSEAGDAEPDVQPDEQPDVQPDVQPDAGGAAAPEDSGHSAGAFSLDAARDALLDTLPADTGADRCARWAALDEDARAVFLVLTDLLGHRTLLADGSRAIEHINTLHAIRGRQQDGCVRCCGDSEHNRLYLSVDDALAHALRTVTVDAWRPSTDLAGPHDPFNQSLETVAGYPRGQLHLFAQDDHAVALGRVGVEHVEDARALELDMDFNLIHESAPLCGYVGGDGRALYTREFATVGDAAPVDLHYAPSGC